MLYHKIHFRFPVNFYFKGKSIFFPRNFFSSIKACFNTGAWYFLFKKKKNPKILTACQNRDFEGKKKRQRRVWFYIEINTK